LYLKKAIELGSENERTWEALFKMYLQNAGQYSEMVQYLSQAHFLFPKRKADWDLYRGVAAYRQQEYADTGKYLQAYYDQADDSTRALFSDTHYFGEAAQGKTAAQYWHSQDPFQLTPYNERQIEHWARIGYTKIFGYTNTDKGEILIRYGLPVITYIEDESNSLYKKNAKENSLNDQIAKVNPIKDKTIKNNSLEEFIIEMPDNEMMNAINNCPSSGVIGTKLRYWIYPKLLFVLKVDVFIESNSFYAATSGAYCNAAPGVEDLFRKDSELNHKGIFDATPVQSQLPKMVAFPQQVSTFRGQSGNTLVINYAGIPLAKQVKSMSQVPDALKTGFFFRKDNSDSTTTQITPSTTYKNKSKLIALQENTLLIVADQQQLKPDAYNIATEFEVGRIRGAQQQLKTIPSYQGNTFMVSDAMLAYHIEGGANGGILQRKDLSITPAPWGVFSTNQPIYVYLEVYNLSCQGNAYPYRVEARLTPKQANNTNPLGRGRRGAKDGVSVSFAQTPQFPNDEAYFMVETIGQPRGQYTLTLQIMNLGTQQVATKEMIITLE
jgi:hypothetical protein